MQSLFTNHHKFISNEICDISNLCSREKNVKGVKISDISEIMPTRQCMGLAAVPFGTVPTASFKGTAAAARFRMLHSNNQELNRRRHLEQVRETAFLGPGQSRPPRASGPMPSPWFCGEDQVLGTCNQSGSSAGHATSFFLGLQLCNPDLEAGAPVDPAEQAAKEADFQTRQIKAHKTTSDLK